MTLIIDGHTEPKYRTRSVTVKEDEVWYEMWKCRCGADVSANFVCHAHWRFAQWNPERPREPMGIPVYFRQPADAISWGPLP